MKTSQSEADEDSVAEFLESYKLQVQRLPERGTSTPDFVVTSSRGFSFYCEVKGIEGVPLSRPFLYRRANDRLKEDLKRSTAQFRAVNSARLAPNVLTWVSHDQRIVRLDDLVLLLEGLRITPGMERWAQPGFQRRKLVKYKAEIDLFILIPKRGGPGSGPSFLLNANQEWFTTSLSGIFDLQASRVVRL